MKEVRVFLEITKSNDGKIDFVVGGGVCNNGQSEVFNDLASAIKDLNERVVVEYHLLETAPVAN